MRNHWCLCVIFSDIDILQIDTHKISSAGCTHFVTMYLSVHPSRAGIFDQFVNDAMERYIRVETTKKPLFDRLTNRPTDWPTDRPTDRPVWVTWWNRVACMSGCDLENEKNSEAPLLFLPPYFVWRVESLINLTHREAHKLHSLVGRLISPRPRPSVCPSVRPSIHPPFHPSVRPSVLPFTVH